MVNESGVMDFWGSGANRASAVAAISADLLSPRLVKRPQFSEPRGFARHARLPNLRELATSLGESSVATVCTDASSIRGWGATLRDHFIQGKWSKLERREGINWAELWVLNRVLEAWRAMLNGKLVLARTDNSTAVTHAKYGAGGVSQLTALARKGAPN